MPALHFMFIHAEVQNHYLLGDTPSTLSLMLGYWEEVMPLRDSCEDAMS